MSPSFVLFAVMLLGVVAVSLLLIRMRQSLLIGYFLCGVLIANSGLLPVLGQENTTESIHQMAEFGIMLLLFTLGMEFSLGEIRHVRKLAFVGGGLQMGVTAVAAAISVALLLNAPPAQLLVLAVACALSSTAIPLKVFQDMELGASPGARTALAFAIFQDLFIIGFLVLLPVLFPSASGESAALAPELAWVAAKGVIFVAISVILARWVIPRLLHAVAGTRSKELFTLAVIGLCIGVALVAGLLNLSMVLGAFVAGLAVSESIYKHRIMADVLPLKDLFLTLFFVSVGLIVDVSAALRNAPLIIVACISLMLVKSVIVVLIGRLLRLRWRTAVLAAFGLCSGGEFSLVLLQKVGQLKPWPGDIEQVCLSVLALSMALVPMLMRHAEGVGTWLEKLFPVKHSGSAGDLPPAKRARILQDHAIICGYGPVGKSLAEALNAQGVPTLVIELNAQTARDLQKAGQPVLFADAAHYETWELAGLNRARLVAFTFPNIETVEQALPLIRPQYENLPILARTKFSSDSDRLLALGVNIIVLDEEESSRATIRHALSAIERPGAAAVSRESSLEAITPAKPKESSAT